MRRLVFIVGGTELAYFVATRLILAHWPAWEWQTELLRTACRAGAALVLWHFCRPLIFSGAPQRGGTRHPLFAATVATFLAVPLLIGDWGVMGAATRFVFAAASIVVGLHEEFLFRGIVQNLLARRWGILRAIVVTSVFMTVWHVGAVPANAFNFFQIFVASCILGLIYARTQRIWLAVSLHTLYDALWIATPVWSAPLSWHWGAALLLAALLLGWLWARQGSWPAPSLNRR